MSLKKIKQERTQQWANNRRVPRGWDRYRASTFLEVVGAKTDRALQCQDLILSLMESKQRNTQEKIKKLEYDALDSCYDAYNYLGKLIERIEKDPRFLCSVRMP